jgi:cytochrome c
MKAVLLAILGCWLLVVAAIPARTLAAQAQEKEASAPSGDIVKGQAIFNDRCAICHYDQSTAQKMGPGLKGIYARGKFANGRKVDDAAMTDWIQKGGKDMPPLKDELKPEEVRALVRYLRTL